VIGSLFQLARPFLHALDPESAHHATLAALQLAWLPRPAPDDPRLAVRAFGLDFLNPIGLAAGFDKDGVAPDNLLSLGFGFVEIGTVTPHPQSGNPRPRLFRLDRDRAVINRLGFNSAGHAKVRENLGRRRSSGGIVGVNLGANKDSEDRVADYVAGIDSFADVASYFTINVSSPNTPGLRDLQQAAALDELLSRALEARDRASVRRPLLLKIAPDLRLSELDDIVRVARNKKIDGMIVSNTTVARPASLASPHGKESGGLSGRPLFDLSTRMLAETFRRTEGQFPLIGVGGIDSPETALAKLQAGATLVQLYSALVFDGPELIARVKRELIERLTAQ
jgi:dihydroorotate dehydrogenase